MNRDHLAALMTGATGETLLDLYLQRPAWHAEAACRGMGPERFYPERGRDPTDARAVCDRCPVTAECLEHALEHEGHGIWAGTNNTTRRQLRHDRKDPA